MKIQKRRNVRGWRIASLIAASAASSLCYGQTSLTGSSLALKNAGSATLSNTGYVGSYLTVPAGGATVNFTVNATEASGSGADPHMNIVIADTSVPFNINSTATANYASGGIALPAGTYNIRAERDYSGNVGVTRSFTVNNLSVNTLSGSTATFANSSSNTNALAASDTYINNYRKGQATVTLSGVNNIPLLAGTPVHVDLGRNAFNFGTAVAGFNGTAYLNGNPTGDSLNYQKNLNANFNAVVPENAGKWASNASGSTPNNSFNISYMNTILDYAQRNNMRSREHNLIWGSQQPTWVGVGTTTGLLTTNPGSLQTTYIPNRINYYVGSNDGNSTNDPARKYQELDVFNESYHTGQVGPTPNYWSVYGASGVASIYNQVAAAAASVGNSNLRLYTNEYNVLADSSDEYANWYRDNIQSIRNAGGAVSGIGSQYYANIDSATGNSAHNPARINEVLQNLSTQGLPITLTEFGVKPLATQTFAGQVLSDTARLVFGTPQATGFFMWGFWHKEMWGGRAGDPNTNGASGAAFYNDDWTPTAVLSTWQSLMSQWDTDLNTTLPANGQVSFNGFYGDYYLSNQGVTSLNAKVLPFDLSLTKGTTSYTQALAKPPGWFLWKTNGSSTWSTAANWTDAPQSGSTPSAAGLTAYFGSSATTYDMSANTTAGAPTTTNITAANITVTLSAPTTLGMLAFGATTSYSIKGSGVMLQGYNNANGHAAAIYDAIGNHTIDAPLTPLDDTTITIAQAANTLTISNLQSTTASLTKAGPGLLKVNNVHSTGANGLTVTGGVMQMLNGGGTSHVSALAVSNAQLDLVNNNLVTGGAGGAAGTWNGSTYTGVSGLVASGRNGGTWDGPGVITSMSDASVAHLTSLGVAAASDVGFTATAVWSGETISPTDALIMYTYGGDATLDGKINVDDYIKIDSGIANAVTGWSNGDFNYDGKINIDDYTIIDNNIGNQGAPFPTAGGVDGLVAIPEPATLAMMLLGSILSLRRRKRQRRP